MNFLTNFLYIFSFLILLLFLFFISKKKGEEWLALKRRKITYILASLHIVGLIIHFSWSIYIKEYNRILLGDLCMFASFFSVPVLILNNEKYFKIFMPWLFIGSLITILGTKLKLSGFYFYGDLSSLINHLTMFSSAFFIFNWIKNYSLQERLTIYIFPVVLIIWILFFCLLPWKVTGKDEWAYFSSGLLEPAFFEGSDYEFFNGIAPYPYATIIFYIIVLAVAQILVVIKNNWKKIIKKLTSFFKKD